MYLLMIPYPFPNPDGLPKKSIEISQKYKKKSNKSRYLWKSCHTFAFARWITVLDLQTCFKLITVTVSSMLTDNRNLSYCSSLKDGMFLNGVSSIPNLCVFWYVDWPNVTMSDRIIFYSFIYCHSKVLEIHAKR